jgi:hypothetical protein
MANVNIDKMDEEERKHAEKVADPADETQGSRGST